MRAEHLAWRAQAAQHASLGIPAAKSRFGSSRRVPALLAVAGASLALNLRAAFSTALVRPELDATAQKNSGARVRARAAAARPAGDPSSANDTAASSAEGAHAAVLQPKADPFAGLPPFHAAVSTLLADSGTGAPPAIAIDSPAAVALKSINVSVALPPFPPSPPSEPPFPPPSPPEVWGKDVGLKITKTSDPRQDASLLARIAAVRMLQQRSCSSPSP